MRSNLCTDNFRLNRFFGARNRCDSKCPTCYNFPSVVLGLFLGFSGGLLHCCSGCSRNRRSHCRSPSRNNNNKLAFVLALGFEVQLFLLLYFFYCYYNYYHHNNNYYYYCYYCYSYCYYYYYCCYSYYYHYHYHYCYSHPYSYSSSSSYSRSLCIYSFWVDSVSANPSQPFQPQTPFKPQASPWVVVHPLEHTRCLLG